MIPEDISARTQSFIYANEADVLNVALFGKTARMWREENPDINGNIRDEATLRLNAPIIPPSLAALRQTVSSESA